MAFTVSAKAPACKAAAAKGVKAMPVLPKKAAAAVAGVVPAVIASPAFAVVDQRLNGDGTGLVFGVNDPALGWVIFGVFSTIWAIYATSAKQFGGQDEEDGMSL